MKLLVKLINLIVYNKFVYCYHEEIEPFGLIDKRCKKCGCWLT